MERSEIQDLYYCCACQSWSVVVDVKNSWGWDYVYCRNCEAVSRSDYVIAVSKAQSHTIAGTGAMN